jgi:hypothetical protein
MPQTTTTHNPCPECRPVFEGQRSHYCREFLRYQRENFAQRTEINALEVQLKHSLEKLLKAERECIQAWKTSQRKPLTEYEVSAIWDDTLSATGSPFFMLFARAIEAAHGIKETTKCSQA